MVLSTWFIFQLLRRNPERRLGSSERDAEDVKKQAFFRVSYQCRITRQTAILVTIIGSVRPIVRTSRTAFVCASDYDDRTQFHMFEQKNEHG